jgi:acyl-ACP thioesterase
MGYEETHPLWIVRRTMIDLIRPIEFQDMLRMRRWCSGTSNRWCEMRVRIDGKRGRPDRIRGVLDQHQPETQGPARISDDFLEGLQRTTDVDRLRWKAYLKPGAREDANQIRDYPVRVTDIDLFDHMNNSVYWSVIEDYLHAHPELLAGRCGSPSSTMPPVALGDKLEILSTCTGRERPTSSVPNWWIALLERSHTWSATRPKRSPRSSRSNRFVRCFSADQRRVLPTGSF